jgi:hypothetical protein
VPLTNAKRVSRKTRPLRPKTFLNRHDGIVFGRNNFSFVLLFWFYCR